MSSFRSTWVSIAAVIRSLRAMAFSSLSIVLIRTALQAKTREEALEIAYRTPGDEWEWVKYFTDTYEAQEVQ